MCYFAYIVLFEDLVVMMAGMAWVFLSPFSSHYPWGEVIFFLFSFIENMTWTHLPSVPQAPAFSALIISRALPSFIQPLSCITAPLCFYLGLPCWIVIHSCKIFIFVFSRLFCCAAMTLTVQRQKEMPLRHRKGTRLHAKGPCYLSFIGTCNAGIHSGLVWLMGHYYFACNVSASKFQ